MSDWQSARARRAINTRHHGAESEVAQLALRDLRAERATDYIQKLVDSAPPLTDEQRSRLVALLSPSAAPVRDLTGAAR